MLDFFSALCPLLCQGETGVSALHKPPEPGRRVPSTKNRNAKGDTPIFFRQKCAKSNSAGKSLFAVSGVLASLLGNFAPAPPLAQTRPSSALLPHSCRYGVEPPSGLCEKRLVTSAGRWCTSTRLLGGRTHVRIPRPPDRDESSIERERA